MAKQIKWLTGAVFAMALANLTLAGCSGGGPTEGMGGRIPVAASTNVWGAVVAAVGGDAVDVKAIIDDPSQDPHDYESTPQDVATIHNAKLVVANGGGYDDFFTKAVEVGSASKESIVAFDLSGKPSTPDTNTHIFYDLPTVKKVSDQAAADLGQLDPAKKEQFATNAKTFETKVDQVMAKIKQIGTQHPGKKVVVTEPIADYLLQAADVADITPPAFVEAVEKGDDIPVLAAQQMEQLISGKQADAVIDNAQTEDDTTRSLESKAAAAGLPVVKVTETLPPGEGDYLHWIEKEINSLVEALTRS